MKFKVGLVGCGNIFPIHAQSLVNIKNVELRAVCDIKAGRVQSAAKKYHCRAYSDYRRMLEEEKLDSVHILTPHYLHPEMSIRALRKKINVLTEKPISVHPRDAEKMVAAAKQNRVKLGVILQNRYNPGSLLVKKHLESGDLGRIKAAKLVLSYAKPDSYYAQSDWKGTLDKEGGGVLIDQAIHFMDLLFWLFKDKVNYVEAHTARRMHRSIEVEDLAEGVVSFRNGAYICFYLINFYSYDDDPEIEIDCEKGRVSIVKDSARIGLYNGKILHAEPRPQDYIDYGDRRRDYWGFSHCIQIKEFYQALGRKQEPEVNGEEGLKTQRVIWSIYQSAKTGKRVYL